MTQSDPEHGGNEPQDPNPGPNAPHEPPPDNPSGGVNRPGRRRALRPDQGSLTAAGPSDRWAGRDKLVRSLALISGAVFLVVGVAGFVPGITTHYGDLSFAGRMSHAKLLGLFQVSVLHDVVHLAFGVAGLALSRTGVQAVVYLIGGGIIYAALWVYGLAIGMDSKANFVPVNNADNWLHVALALGLLTAGILGQRRLRGGVGSQTPM